MLNFGWLHTGINNRNQMLEVTWAASLNINLENKHQGESGKTKQHPAHSRQCGQAGKSRMCSITGAKDNNI